MRSVRPATAVHPAAFGRRAFFLLEEPASTPPSLLDDLRLFATTFLAGFVFVSVLLA